MCIIAFGGGGTPPKHQTHWYQWLAILSLYRCLIGLSHIWPRTTSTERRRAGRFSRHFARYAPSRSASLDHNYDRVTVATIPDLTLVRLQAENPGTTLRHNTDPTGIVHCPQTAKARSTASLFWNEYLRGWQSGVLQQRHRIRNAKNKAINRYRNWSLVPISKAKCRAGPLCARRFTLGIQIVSILARKTPSSGTLAVRK